ncbi:hypothetical protein PNEG_01105 [Pneumocystis murina B123]|uniref:Peptidase M16 N-terminal domain-containing protein n=1 Tax=Pneumocystis murina (strain B123) TaxID=1069680 RepID=M7PIW5_PNEMU|nr:hypothetical protein PNEG_01105 [Pneumocystis murina B123]EMR10389.1 hypothetical protein PNEG_01105 [Pneumocystis murina B123]
MKLTSLLLLSLTLITKYTKSNEFRDLNNAAKDPNSNYNPSHVEIIEKDFEKSTLDDSEYRVVKLQNGIEVALVSDPSVRLAATSVAVRVGSKDDPKGFPGLAHLCEYLLFMGTEKYPLENEYTSFVLNHGGSFDSYRGLERTVFISEINPKYHYEQLDRMANFFIKPLFREDLIERETHFINSEFEEYRSSFSKARFHFLNYILKDTGLFPEFTTGNRQTLFSEPRAKNMSVKKALEDFFDNYYHSRDIKVAVCGNESLDTLQELVQKTFGQIPDKKERAIDDVNPFSSITKYHYWYNFSGAPYTADIAFIVPSSRVHYKSVPFHYLNYIFSYSGPDSPIDYFSKKSLASRIRFSNIEYSSKYDLLFVSLKPLYVGRLFYEELILEFFKCIQFFKENGPNKAVFEDIMKAQNTNFKYSFKESVSQLVDKLSTSLLADSFPRKYLLKQDIIKEYNKEEFDEFFSALNYENFISFSNTIRKGYNETDPYYNITYLKQSHKKRFIEKLKNISSPNLKYPPKNIYLDESDITMEKLNETLTKPDLLKDTYVSTLWHKHASFFYCPYGVIRILLKNPFVSSTPSNMLKIRFLQIYIYSSLPFDFLLLSTANVNFYITPTLHGLIIMFYGYTNKMMELVTRVINTLKETSLDHRLFNPLRSTLIYSYIQRISAEPSTFLEIDIDDILFSERQPFKNMLFVLDQFQHSDVNAFFYNLLNNFHFDVLITGNIPKEDALHIHNMLETTFSPHPLTSSQRHYINTRAITLEDGSDYFRVHELSKSGPKSALFMYFEAAEMEDSRRVMLFLILYLILREPIYHELKTKEQLGHIIKSDIKVSRNILGYYILVQSERQPHVLHSRIDAFLNRMLDRILNLTSKELNYHLESLQYFLKKDPSNILSENLNVWSSVVNAPYTSNSDFEPQKADPIEPHELVNLFKEVFYSKRKRFSYTVTSTVTSDIYNLYDLPLDKLSEYLSSKGENVSKEELYNYVLLSHDFPSFRIKLSEHLSKNRNQSDVKSILDETIKYLKRLYLLEKYRILKPLSLVDNIAYFKASLELSPAFVYNSLSSEYHK